MKNELYMHCNKPVQAWRLGKQFEDKPRPIKLKFEDESAKWTFIRHVSNKSTRTIGMFC